MMAYINRNWYEHLVDQSRTDNIYTLIHGNLYPDWDPGHDLDFVVIRKKSLPANVFPRGIQKEHIAVTLSESDYCFPDSDYVLLDNEHLTAYLEAAKAMQIIEDHKGRQFIELIFSTKQDKKPEVFSKEPKIDIHSVTPENLPKPEDALFVAYELLKTHTDKRRALEFAMIAESFLDSNRVYVGAGPDVTLWNIKHKMIGYNIVAMVYAWNNRMVEAAALDSQYLFHPNVWDELEVTLSPYLEMLMAGDQVRYLKFIFKDLDFRNRFRAHYEAFVSLFLDDTYILTRPGEVVGIINRVNHSKRDYGL